MAHRARPAARVLTGFDGTAVPGPMPKVDDGGKYRRRLSRRVRRNDGYDVYDVLVAYAVTCPALAHSIKKLLMPGGRGAKDRLTDLREARVSLDEAIRMAEDAALDSGEAGK